MATVEELLKQYETDPALRDEVDRILEDGRITLKEFKSFIKNHALEVSLLELPNVIAEAKRRGLIE